MEPLAVMPGARTHYVLVHPVGTCKDAGIARDCTVHMDLVESPSALVACNM